MVTLLIIWLNGKSPVTIKRICFVTTTKPFGNYQNTQAVT